MKLWLLRPIEGAPGDPWEPWYDKVFGFVVRAETEAEARELAAPCCGDEGAAPWLSPGLSTCEQLTGEGEAGVIIRDEARA